MQAWRPRSIAAWNAGIYRMTALEAVNHRSAPDDGSRRDANCHSERVAPCDAAIGERWRLIDISEALLVQRLSNAASVTPTLVGSLEWFFDLLDWKIFHMCSRVQLIKRRHGQLWDRRLGRAYT
jgi:hypothetical protein